MAEWQPFDTVPTDGTVVLIWHQEGWYGLATFRPSGYGDIKFLADSHAWAGTRRGETYPSVWMGGKDARTAFRWMPLPSAPA